MKTLLKLCLGEKGKLKMLLYDVFYNDRTFDRSIPLPKTVEFGTTAMCVNGKQTWQAFTKDGWIDVQGQTQRFEEINNTTGFANGDLFDSEEEVKDYFTIKNMQEMFPSDFYISEDDLDDMLADVLANHWHCRF